MQNKQQITTQIKFVKTLRMITEAYEDISVLRMQRVRNSVLKLREYLNKFSNIFIDVKSSYRAQILRLMKKNKVKDTSKLSIINKNGKTVSVLISANTKLHGDIVPKVIRLFIESIKKDNSDIVIVGKLGRAYFEQQEIKRQYVYFEIPDMNLKVDDIKPIVYNIVNYEKINVYYGRFENIVTQIPTVSNITGNQSFDANNKGIQIPKEKRYIFEPSLERILRFFETQIFSSLFKQTIHEAELARFASRLKGMEEALTNIDERIHYLYTERRKIKAMQENKKQLEMFAGVALWKN